MLTPEFLAASMIALGIKARHETTGRAHEETGTARDAGQAEVRSRRGRRARKRGIPPESWERR